MPIDRHVEPCVKEAVCVHTKKVYDLCRSKDCSEDLRVYLTRSCQCVLDRALSVKARRAELLWVYSDIEPVSFNRGFYTVDVRYFYRVTVDAYCGPGRPQEITGLATCEKRVILFGSEGNAKIFSSDMSVGAIDEQLLMRSNLPKAVVEVVDPIVLGVKLVETCNCPCQMDCVAPDVPRVICGCFDDELILGDGEKRLYITLGQFSIIKLERDSQLLMPAYDFCIPEKECVASTEEDPCDLFARISFPNDEFFPPSRECLPEQNCGCR